MLNLAHHYHLLIETPESNLSLGMRQLNGVYTQRFNRCHCRVGRVFQGRYKAILVEKHSYLSELARYIVLNPVRARMVYSASQWPWSSFGATAGYEGRPEWLTVDWLLSSFGRSRHVARKRYEEFVESGHNQPSPWKFLKNQVFLGNDQFVKDMQARIEVDAGLNEIPTGQKRPLGVPLEHYRREPISRNAAIVKAWTSGCFTMKEIADHFGLHYSSISKIIRSHELSQIKT